MNMEFQHEAVREAMTTSIEDINWDSVVSNELPRLYNYFRYRLGDDTLAEDLTSTVLEKAWLKRQHYRKDRAAFATWLFAIARNEVIAYLRKRWITVPLDMAEKTSSVTTENVFDQSQNRQQLISLLNELPDRERELISLKFGAELNNREIAVAMHISESNVGTILSRTIQKLHAQWERKNER